MGGEEKTIKVNFTSDGIERLRNDVSEKLKEFMGDYTDDTLVEYVIVLLRNGRTKDEARNELNVFLGDEDSNSFVTWLWDNLSANLNLYVLSDDSGLNEEAKQKPMPRDPGISQVIQIQNCTQNDRVDQVAGYVDKNMENPHSEYATKTCNLRSVIGSTHFEEKNQHKPVRTRKSLSPLPSSRKKRNRLEERHHPERNIGLLAAINPSSRLLQSAVREAVGTAGLPSKATEPSAKRLHSVVATSSFDDSRRRLRSVATISSSIAGVALKAAMEAAEDVLRVRPSGNVFDRLGRGVDVVERNTDFTDNDADVDHEFNDKVAFQPQLYQHQMIKDGKRFAGELINQEAEFNIGMDQDGIDEADGMSFRNSSIFQTSTSVQMDDDSTTTRFRSTANSYRLKSKYQSQPEVHPSYDEYVNVLVNANFRKPRPYLPNNEIAGPNSSRIMQSGDVSCEISGGQLLNKNSNGLVGTGNGKSALLPETDSQMTTSGATGSAANVALLEDADARTIFVSNVHFATNKDNLSRHFMKFGQVLRVTILIDAATGLPKGSAYVEFMQKEAAVQATSLDGTSFMSRIIKVCMKGSAQPETPTPATTAWPRAVPRGSPYPVPRFSRPPFPRGNPSSFRGRGIARPGARSLQWKREAQPAPATKSETTTAGAPPGNSAPVRSLTYVRPELKAEGVST